MNKSTVEDRAYIAGFLDGEGSIVISRLRKGNRYWLQPFLTISQNDPSPLKYIQSFYGGSIYINHRHNHMLRFLNTKSVLLFLAEITPYLIVKRKQANLMIKYCQSRLSHLRSFYTENELKLYKQIRDLNAQHGKAA